MLDPKKIKKDFPILNRKIKGKKLVYLDNAATSQKPLLVINAISDYYKSYNANIHRAVHTLAEEATSLYEASRERIARFFGSSIQETIFVKNTTEGINLVAFTWGDKFLEKGDEVILSDQEHHSNIVPWLILAEKKGIRIKYLKTPKKKAISADMVESMITKKTKIVCLTHISNVLGVVNPIEKISKVTNKKGVKFLVDGSQSAPRMKIDFSRIGCDFFVATGHKMCGPTGIGVLLAKEKLLKSMPPFLGGGDMIKKVTFNSFTTNDLPYKFEAGTPHIAGVIGLGKAVEYLSEIGMEEIFSYEKELTCYALKKLKEVKDIVILGPYDCSKRLGVISFNLKGVHPHDLAQILNEEGVAVRSGNHCAMPLHKQTLGINASTRVSFFIYNTQEDVDILIKGVYKAKDTFKKN